MDKDEERFNSTEGQAHRQALHREVFWQDTSLFCLSTDRLRIGGYQRQDSGLLGLRIRRQAIDGTRPHPGQNPPVSPLAWPNITETSNSHEAEEEFRSKRGRAEFLNLAKHVYPNGIRSIADIGKCRDPYNSQNWRKGIVPGISEVCKP